MRATVGELERIEVEEDDVEMWFVEIVLEADSAAQLDRDQETLERLADRHLQVVLAHGSEEFDLEQRSVFFTVAPRTLDLRLELEAFLGSILPPLDEPGYPLSSPFDLFGGDGPAL
jgi:hypothetical protein